MARINKRNKYESPAYWTQLIQLMLHDNIKRYLEENNMTRSEFAERLGVSKGYVSQILNGDFDHKLSKLTELILACDMIPRIELVPKRYATHVMYDTYLQPTDWKRCSTYVRTIPFKTTRPHPTKFTQISSITPIRMSSQMTCTEDNWITDTNLISQDKIA